MYTDSTRCNYSTELCSRQSHSGALRCRFTHTAIPCCSTPVFLMIDKSGVPKQAIKISRAKIFVNNVEYGSFSQSGFVLASARPEALSNDHPNNHDPQTLCKGTSSTTQSASHVSPFTPVSQPTIANDPMLHISHNGLSPSSANVPTSSSPDHSNLSSPSQ